MFGGWSQGERNDVQLCDLAAPTEADDAVATEEEEQGQLPPTQNNYLTLK